MPHHFQKTVAFLDPSAAPSNPGWPLRNLLAYLRFHHSSDISQGVRILCWRDADPPHNGQWKSRFGVVKSSSDNVKGVIV